MHAAGVFLLEAGVQLDLVEHRQHAGFIGQPLQMRLQKIGHADGLRLAGLLDLDESLPGVDIKIIVRARPVDQHEVDRIPAQPVEAFVERLQRPIIALALIPHLGGEPDIVLALQPRAHALFIFIDRCGIDQLIADLHRLLHRLLGILVILDLIGAESQLGNRATIIQIDHWGLGDAVGAHGKFLLSVCPDNGRTIIKGPSQMLDLGSAGL